MENFWKKNGKSSIFKTLEGSKNGKFLEKMENLQFLGPWRGLKLENFPEKMENLEFLGPGGV